jgi:hypothetical protein
METTTPRVYSNESTGSETGKAQRKKLPKAKKKSRKEPAAETSTFAESQNNKTYSDPPSDAGPPGKCIDCGNDRMWSVRTGKFIQRCVSCADTRRTKNRDSYHARHKSRHKEEAMEEQLASRGEKLYAARRDCAGLRERLAVTQKRLDAVQEAYEGSQKMLAAALDKANGGRDNDTPLPSAVSVRNESIVIQRLQELTEIVTERRSEYAAELAATRASMEDERARNAETMASNLRELERAMEKLMR